VKIRHAGGYQTAYLHLSGFALGIRAGVRVVQGQDIGYVGSTGTATGPHLDYRVIKNGTYLNPMTAFSKMPAGDPLPATRLPAFQVARDEVVRQMRERLSSPGSVTANASVR
jgi:murein DD-endopeptidase MepM/ murein hydrolase activator NlpD